MRIPCFYLITIVLLSSCARPTITMTWQSPQDYDRQFENIMIFGLIENVSARLDFENEITYAAYKTNLRATNSLAIFPPELGKPMEDIEKFKKTLRDRGFDSILTLSLIDIRAPRYVAGDVEYQPLVYYDRFRNYYYKTYESVYVPGYINLNTRYFAETNLYELKGGTLVWSGRSEVFDPSEIQAYSRTFARELFKELYGRGIIVASEY